MTKFNFASLEKKVEKKPAEIAKTTKPVLKSNFKTKKKPIKPKKVIIGDKDLNKDQISDYLANYILENKDNFTLDWLRGQKLTFESVKERK